MTPASSTAQADSPARPTSNHADFPPELAAIIRHEAGKRLADHGSFFLDSFTDDAGVWVDCAVQPLLPEDPSKKRGRRLNQVLQRTDLLRTEALGGVGRHRTEHLGQPLGSGRGFQLCVSNNPLRHTC